VCQRRQLFFSSEFVQKKKPCSLMNALYFAGFDLITQLWINSSWWAQLNKLIWWIMCSGTWYACAPMWNTVRQMRCPVRLKRTSTGAVLCSDNRTAAKTTCSQHAAYAPFFNTMACRKQASWRSSVLLGRTAWGMCNQEVITRPLACRIFFFYKNSKKR